MVGPFSSHSNFYFLQSCVHEHALSQSENKGKNKIMITCILYQISNQSKYKPQHCIYSTANTLVHVGPIHIFLPEWTQGNQYFSGLTNETTWRQWNSIEKSVLICGLLSNLCHKITVVSTMTCFTNSKFADLL